MSTLSAGATLPVLILWYWLCGAAIFVHHTSGFYPATSLQMFGRLLITTFCGAPTIYRMFRSRTLRKLSSRRCATVRAGEPLNPEVIEIQPSFPAPMKNVVK